MTDEEEKRFRCGENNGQCEFEALGTEQEVMAAARAHLVESHGWVLS